MRPYLDYYTRAKANGETRANTKAEAHSMGCSPPRLCGKDRRVGFVVVKNGTTPDPRVRYQPTRLGPSRG